MTAWWRRWRRARTLSRRPVPDALWQLTLARHPFLGRRRAADLADLRDMTTLFLAEKEFNGAGGLEIRDDMAVAIAAQACLPALKLGLDCFDRFVGIVVHPDAVVAKREIEDEDGIVHTWDEELAGEAMSGGPVMLAWRDVEDAGETADDGYNVVVHEFAHVIDMRNGLTRDAHLDDDSSATGRWRRALFEEYETFAELVEADDPTFLDPYAAESVEEYFAVTAESFFVSPEALLGEAPRTYALLTECFGQDPAAAGG